MEELDVSEGFDVCDHRYGLKLIREELFVNEKRTNTFGDPGSPFCLVRTDEELLLLTHPTS
jgi:hypothetical protein